MPQFPAHCEVCGLTFFSGIAAENSTDITLVGNRSQCPRCGRWASIVEGTFDVGRGPHTRFTQTAGTPVDVELFTRLGLILVQAHADRLPPSAIIEKIGPHSPSLARRLSRVMDDPVAFATVIAAFIAFFGMVTVALITSGNAPSTIINNIKIENHPSRSELERKRDDLWKLRKRNIPVPSWVRDYIEPQEG